MILPGLRGYCHLPINFLFQVYFWATNGNPLMQFLLLIASLWSIHVCLSFSLIPVGKIASTFQSKEEVRLTESSFVCMCTRWTSTLSTERAARGCYVAEVHHSHLPVCQMSCLAELHTVMVSTKWQKGGTLQWMSIWLQSTGSPGALKLPHTKQKKKRTVVYKRLVPQN